MRRLGAVGLLTALLACESAPPVDEDCTPFGSCCVICSQGACGDACLPAQTGEPATCDQEPGCACSVEEVCEPVGCCIARCKEGPELLGGDFSLDHCATWADVSCEEAGGLDTWEAVEGCVACDARCLPE